MILRFSSCLRWMKKHVKIYTNFFGYGMDDFIPCEVQGCADRAVDVHHIDRRGMGGSKSKDFIENLVGLCRKHHELAEANPNFNEIVREMHMEKIKYVWSYLN